MSNSKITDNQISEQGLIKVFGPALQTLFSTTDAFIIWQYRCTILIAYDRNTTYLYVWDSQTEQFNRIGFSKEDFNSSKKPAAIKLSYNWTMSYVTRAKSVSYQYDVLRNMIF